MHFKVRASESCKNEINNTLYIKPNNIILNKPDLQDHNGKKTIRERKSARLLAHCVTVDCCRVSLGKMG